MVLVFILGFTFIVGKPKLNPAAAAHESIDLPKDFTFIVDKPEFNPTKVADIYKASPNVVYYLPKRDEEIEYWLK
jgi:hypothetical protein